MTPFFDDRVAGWVSKRIGLSGDGFGNCRALGVGHKGKIVAGVVFHNWEPDHGVIELSAVATHRGWMTREVMRVAMAYVFDGLGCQAAIARVAERNEPARHIWRALGSEEHIIPRLYGRDEAGCIYVLTCEAWSKSRLNKR